jgi:hypothetical protein|nr:MAG TPA: hypothetical protein [Caudoviricetes sp.]
MFNGPKPIHRYVKVVSFDELCVLLQRLQPNGWAVYGDTLEKPILEALANQAGSSFSSTGGSLQIETRPVEFAFEPTFQVDYRLTRGEQVVSKKLMTTDPDFEFYNNQGVKEVLSWQEWDTPGPIHVILPQRLIHTDVPEMFDANIMFVRDSWKLATVKTKALTAPIFVCSVEGLYNVA